MTGDGTYETGEIVTIEIPDITIAEERRIEIGMGEGTFTESVSMGARGSLHLNAMVTPLIAGMLLPSRRLTRRKASAFQSFYMTQRALSFADKNAIDSILHLLSSL